MSMRRVHAILTFVWLALTVPAVLIWRDSVSFVVFASVYANVAAHWSAWQASRAEDASNQQ